MNSLDELQSIVAYWVRIVAVTVLLLVTSTLSLFGYWYYEPDPLEVSYTKAGSSSVCIDRKYPLARLVTTTKNLSINVKEYWSEDDGMMVVNNILQEDDTEYPAKELAHYTLLAGTNKAFTFPKSVPADLWVGRYTYRPSATYRVNPIKVITRDLPTQKIVVVCDYDQTKHGTMQ
jgi:hypothetical protein